MVSALGSSSADKAERDALPRLQSLTVTLTEYRSADLAR